MAQHKYDIFISYRRDGGAQYARILQLMLIQRGYKVFLDYDELTDGIFSDKIKAAINDAPVFLLVLSKGSMARCVNEGDWVRQEITLAIEQNKHIVPVNPDNGFDGFPRAIPDYIKESIGSHQHSEISFGQALGATVDLMIANRLIGTLGERTSRLNRDENFDAAKETLHKQEIHNRFMKRMGITCAIAIVIIILVTCLCFWKNQKDRGEHLSMRLELQEKYSVFNLQLNPDLSIQQLEIIDTLLANMSEIYTDSIWMSQFEFTRGQWYGIKGETCDENKKNLPITNISYGDIYMFLVDIGNMTNLQIELPSADVWEYAAQGGENHETTLYAGDDDVNKVAWYENNSNGYIHPSDGQQGKEPNRLDLYDMSGNAGELCNSPFDDTGLYTVCGGSYNSPASDVTVTSRKGLATDAKNETVGFRIIIRK